MSPDDVSLSECLCLLWINEMISQMTMKHCFPILRVSRLSLGSGYVYLISFYSETSWWTVIVTFRASCGLFPLIREGAWLFTSSAFTSAFCNLQLSHPAKTLTLTPVSSGGSGQINITSLLGERQTTSFFFFAPHVHNLAGCVEPVKLEAKFACLLGVSCHPASRTLFNFQLTFERSSHVAVTF